jgi:hypothetical protein
MCPQAYSDTAGLRCGTTPFEPPFRSRTYWASRYQYFRNTSAPLQLEAPWTLEIDRTASVLIQSAATLSLLVKSDFNANRNGPISNFDNSSLWWKTFASTAGINTHHTAIVQFGDPMSQSQDYSTFSGFSPDGTLNLLRSRSLGDSLQARVLSQGGLMRLFRIQDIIDTSTGAYVLQNIYTAIAVQVQNCTVIYVPDTVSVWCVFGLLCG